MLADLNWFQQLLIIVAVGGSIGALWNTSAKADKIESELRSIRHLLQQIADSRPRHNLP